MRDIVHTAEIRAVWEANYKVYGAERVWRALARADYRIARCTVERLMSTAGIHGVVRGKRLFTTIADGDADRPADLVERRFVATRPNQLWVTDVERHEAPTDRAVMKGHRLQPVAAGWLKLRAA